MTIGVRLFRDDRSCLLLILPIALVLCAFRLGGRDLWAPDEPRTGVIVSGILQRGDWAVLREDGRPYLEKPPLYFWLAAAASLPAGRPSELSLRLPASLAAVLAVLLLFHLGRDLFGRRPAALGALVLLTMQNFFMEARWAHTDMLFALLLLISSLALLRAWRGRGDRRWLLAFYLAMGGATLVKGPAGLLLPLLALAIFLAVSRDLGFLRRAHLAPGLLLACAPGVAWLLSYAASSGGPFPVGTALLRLGRRALFGLHHVESLPHQLAGLAIDALPWTLVLPQAIAASLPRRGARADRENAYLWSWIAALSVPFLLAAEKRGVYLLPLLPFLALLVGRLWDMALLGWDPSPVGRGIGAGLWAGVAAAGIAAAFFLPRIAGGLPDAAGAARWLAAALVLTALAAVATHHLRGAGAALSVLCGGLVVSLLLVAGAVLPALDPYKSARPFAARAAAAASGRPLGIYPDYHAAYAFYAGRPIARLTSRAGLDAFLRATPGALCLMEEDQFEAERRTLDLPLRIVDRARVGHRRMVLVGAGPWAPEEAAP